MANNGDILQFTLQGYYATPATTVLNVFQYELSVDDPIDFALVGQEFIDAWYTELEPALSAVISQEVQYNDVTIHNLTNPLEIYVGTFSDPLQGAVSGEVLPPFVSWSFMLRRTNTSTRNGQKRFPGVPESMQVSGVPTSAASVGLGDLAAVIGETMELDIFTDPATEAELIPVIVRKNSEGAMISNQRVLNAVFRSIGSQNTRKLGRGS